ncbi:YadA-like C-terminal domain protein [Acinetobacter sp. WC-323]|nr:YadA-like C-terminal domain protein [Acinetobacter sp. WC-323]
MVGADENITTKVQDGKVAIELAKDLNVNSVTAGDTLMNTDGVTIAGGPSVTKSGIDAAGNKVTNVADGDINPDSKDAINGSQLANNAQSVADALGGGSTVNPDGTVSSPTYNINGTDTGNVGDALAELDKGWTLQSNGANSGAVKAGDTVDIGTADGEENLQVTKEGNDIKYSLNRNLNIDSITAGDTVINNDGMSITGGPSITKSGIDAGNKKVTGVDAGTISADSTDAVNGSQINAQGEGVKNIIGGNTAYDANTGTYTNPDFGGTGQDNINDAIAVVGQAATAAKTEVEAGKNMTVDSKTDADGHTIYTVATADDVEFNSVKVGDVNIDGATGKISGVTDGTVAAGSTDAINGSQLHNTAQSTADALGGGSTVNPDGTVSAPNYTVNGNNVNNVGDAITELDKGWTLQSNAANSGAVKAGDTVDIGTADGEENLQVAKEGNDIKYSLNRDLNVDSVTAGDTVINNDGMSIAGGPSITKSGIDAAGSKITGVAAGAVRPDSTEAINGSQLNAQGEGVKNIIGGNTQYDPNTGKYTNPDIGGTGKDNINDAIGAVGAAAKAAKTTVTEGDNMVVTESKNADGSTNYEVATAKDVKFDSVTSTDEEGNETVLTAQGTQVKDGEGNEAEYGAKGVTLKDQDGNGTVLNSTGLGFVDPMGNNIGPSITSKGIDAGNTVITGVAAGRVAADSQDAINGSQLKGVSDSVAKSIGGNTTVNPDGTINTSNIGGTGKDNINDAIGAVGDAAKAAKSTVSDGKNIVVKESKNADGSTDYEVSTSSDLDVDSVTAGGTRVDGDGLHIDGGPSVTQDGIDAGDKKVTGVADGTVAKDSKDAVNGGQLKGVSDSVAGAIGGNTTVNPDGTIKTSNIGGTGKNNVNDAIESVKNDAKAAKTSVSNTDNNLTINKTTKTDGSTDYEVGLADKIKVKQVDADQVNVAGDQGKTSISGGGISITGPKGEQGPSMTTSGINAGGKKVTGVADGAIAKDSQDAVNGSQLHQSYQDVGAALGGGAGYDPAKGWTGPSYEVGGAKHDNVGDALGALDNADKALGDRITNLGDQMQQAFYDTNQRIDDVKKHANAGVAAAMALETAPYISGKYTYAVGAAYHGGENAVGVTLRKTADNGRWSLTTGVAAASQGDPSFRVGLSGVFD